MSKPVKLWLPAFMRFIELIRITSKDAPEPVPIIPYEGQKRFLRMLTEGLEEDIHHFTILKARQLGVSTLMLALDIFWLYMHPGLQGALIADTADNKEIFRQTITEMLESLPRGYQVRVKSHNRSALVLANGSRLQYMSAGKQKNSGLGRSRALNYVHACCAPGTPVIVEDGRIKPIEEVRVGDVVLTHTGERTMVVDAVGQPNTKGDLIRITPWLGQPMSFTSEHTIPTHRGIVEAKDVRNDDWLIMPVRQIAHDVSSAVLPTTPIRPQGAGAQSVGSGAEIALDEEMGFACGYYLAEGTILRSARGDPTGVQFARHRSERAYAERALAAISSVTSGWRTVDRADSLTTVEFAYGASFSRWLDDTFGSLDDKHIPDDVFLWGEDFCRGLLAGLLCGDGSKGVRSSPTRNRVSKPRITRSGKLFGRPKVGPTDPGKTYPISQVVLPTTRSSLAMQARDLAASLGCGWASISVKEAGNHYGRNCKTCWRVTWNGGAAAKLREVMGLGPIPGGRSWVNKYKIENGLVYIKIRKIEGGIKADTIYDLSVQHEDHTFRTPYFSVGNTECSSWGDQKGLDSLLRSLSEKNPNRLYIFESTALGFNLFFDMCELAKRDTMKKFFFIGWWAKDTYRLDRGSSEYDRFWTPRPSLNEEEQIVADDVMRQYAYEIDDEQWAYYRKYREDSEDEASAMEEMPSTEKEAFQATGNSFFSLKRVTADMEVISKSQVTFTGYRYIMGSNFLQMKLQQTKNLDEIELKVYEEPIKNAVYVFGVDPAYGRESTKDRSCISIWRCYADKLVQVAEYNTPWPETQQVAWAMAHLAGCYRDCMINLEIQGGGSEVLRELDYLRQQISIGQLRELAPSLNEGFALDQARWYLYHKPDSMGAGYAYGWLTTFNNKWRLMNRLRDSYNTETLIIRSMGLLQEMVTFVQDGDKLHASGRNKDDRVMAASLACFAWAEWRRVEMMASGRTFDRENRKEQEASLKGGRVVDWLVAQHFENAKRARAEAELQKLLEP